MRSIAGCNELAAHHNTLFKEDHIMPTSLAIRAASRPPGPPPMTSTFFFFLAGEMIISFSWPVAGWKMQL
jgi:hypothetical protein